MNLVVGIDAGTHGVRVIITDSKGNVIGESRDSYKFFTPHLGWVEQDAEDWWSSLKKAFRGAVSGSNVDCGQIEGLSISHQRCTVVPVDNDNKPLRRAMLWNDSRAVKQAEEVESKLGAEEVVRRTGFPPTPNWAYVKAMWVKENEPEVFKKTSKWMLVHDFLANRLTGEFKTSSSSATMAGIFNPSDTSFKSWAEDVMEKCGLDVSRWPEICLPGEVVGTVTKEASKASGLPEGIPVAAGAGDQPSGALGAGVTEYGLMSLNLGTSVTLEIVTPTFKPDPVRYVVELNPALLYSPEAFIIGGTRTIDWFIENFRDTKERPETYFLNFLTDKARKVPVGTYGLMMVPYWGGAVHPYMDPGARGIITGFGYVHDKYCMFRAILEGIAYEVRKLMELMEEGIGAMGEEIRLYGGGSANPLWCQIIADITGKRIRTLKNREASAVGAAILAAKAADMYGDVKEASKSMVQLKDTYEPKSKNKKIYDNLYEKVYRRYYDRVKDLMHETSEITGYYP